jgi:hypothetical protein
MAANEEAGAPNAPTEKGQGSKSSKTAAKSAQQPDLLTITIEIKTGQIVKVESVDAAGDRHELSDKEKVSLAKERGKATLETVLEQVFEAGIASVLGDEGDEDEAPESDEELDLRHTLLRPLIERSAAKRLMRRNILSRAILETLIQHAASRANGPEGASAKQRARGRQH